MSESNFTAYATLFIIAIFLIILLILDVERNRSISTSQGCKDYGGQMSDQNKCLFGQERKCFEYCWPKKYFHSGRTLLSGDDCECGE